MSRAAADQLTSEGHAMFEQRQYAEAAARFERATVVFPTHAAAWKGLGHCLLVLGRLTPAARAFDRAIGLAPDSATALWGGALAHAELGNRLVARNYLERALALQPSWVEMARGVPRFAGFLQLSARAADLLRGALGPYSARAFRHATDPRLVIEVLRIADQPERGLVTYASLGVCDVAWPEDGRPRVELVMASTATAEVCGAIVANTAFHLIERRFFPEPGSIVRDVIGVLGAGPVSAALPHVYFTVPLRWPLPRPLDDGPPAITTVALVPIAEAEYQVWKEGGPRALDAALATAEPGDLARAPAAPPARPAR